MQLNFIVHQRSTEDPKPRLIPANGDLLADLPASNITTVVVEPFVLVLVYESNSRSRLLLRRAPCRYTNTLALTDGSTIQLKQRERPQIFFNESTGQPALLFTGVAPPWAKFYGYTYTHAQPIRQ